MPFSNGCSATKTKVWLVIEVTASSRLPKGLNVIVPVALALLILNPESVLVTLKKIAVTDLMDASFKAGIWKCWMNEKWMKNEKMLNGHVSGYRDLYDHGTSDFIPVRLT